MNHDDAPTDRRGEALDWLTGRLRWEQILRDLHDKAEAADAPDALVIEVAPPARQDERAA